MLTLELARLLDPSEYGSDILAPVFDKLAKVNPRAVWTPTAENFSSGRARRLSPSGASCAASRPTARAFAKAKNGREPHRLETLLQAETEMPAD